MFQKILSLEISAAWQAPSSWIAYFPTIFFFFKASSEANLSRSNLDLGGKKSHSFYKLPTNETAWFCLSFSSSWRMALLLRFCLLLHTLEKLSGMQFKEFCNIIFLTFLSGGEKKCQSHFLGLDWEVRSPGDGKRRSRRVHRPARWLMLLVTADGWRRRRGLWAGTWGFSWNLCLWARSPCSIQTKYREEN